MSDAITDLETKQLFIFRTYLIAEDLVQWPIGLHKTVHSSQPQTQETVVDALHQYYLRHNEDWVPDVAAEMTGHLRAASWDTGRPICLTVNSTSVFTRMQPV